MKTLEEVRRIFEADRFATENVTDDLGNLTATVMVTGCHVG